jgi:hypothetical protein
MSKQQLSAILASFRRQRAKAQVKRSPRRRPSLSYESLETREMMAVQPLADLSVSASTGEKPQSKLWEYAGKWWTVMPNSSGTWVHRLDGTSWTPTVQISGSRSTQADVKVVGDLAHVLLFEDDTAQLASLQYDTGPDKRFEPWSQRPQLATIPLSGNTETATLEVDSTDRMWVAYDVKSTVEVRYSDGIYGSWSAPITIASGINSDDISTIIALPNGSIGVFWSNQGTDRFGFRVHQDGAAPTAWSADELPASQSALRVGGGMADDHVHVAVASDSTLYAAVKTSYDKSGYPKIALLVRRPNGSWDNLYAVDNNGTRPTVVLNEAANRLIVAYTTDEGGGDIVYRESPLGTIALAPRQTLINGGVNDVTTTKQVVTDDVVFLAAGGGSARGVRFTFNTIAPNQVPLVNAGPNLAAVEGEQVFLNGTVTDDGPAGSLLAAWSKVSGPGTVSFGNSAAVDTTATFSAAGSYVLRLTASDATHTTFDEIVVVVTPEIIVDPEIPPLPPTENPIPAQIAFQNGLFPSLAYAGSSDTKINSGSKNKNYGTATSLMVDGKPDEAALFRWDVSAIPSGSIVVSAALELNALSTTKGNFELYALQRAWDDISATWNQSAAGSPWGTAGANGAGDHGSTPLGSLAPTATGMYHIALNQAGVAAVQAWIDHAATNYGIIVKDYAVNDGLQISSSETGSAALRPKLIINYEPATSSQQTAPASVADLLNLAPIVSVGPDLTVQLGQTLSLNGVVSDDGQPDSLALLNVLWSKVSGPGIATFNNSSAVDTTVQFSVAGTYVLRLSANDGELADFDELTVTVSGPVEEEAPRKAKRRRWGAWRRR